MVQEEGMNNFCSQLLHVATIIHLQYVHVYTACIEQWPGVIMRLLYNTMLIELCTEPS